MSDLAERLRRTIEGDKAIAEAAEQASPAPWSAEVGTMWGCALICDATGEGLWDCEGSETLGMEGAAAVHAALHDPRDTIARCEAELAILDEHHATNGETSCAVCIVPDWGYPTHGGSSPAPYPCGTIISLASGYRHRDGYAEVTEP